VEGQGARSAKIQRSGLCCAHKLRVSLKYGQVLFLGLGEISSEMPYTLWKQRRPVWRYGRYLVNVYGDGGWP